MSIQWNRELYHYGMPRRSGRYKWGSGKNPYQGDGSSNTKGEERHRIRNVKEYSARRIADTRNKYISSDEEERKAMVKKALKTSIKVVATVYVTKKVAIKGGHVISKYGRRKMLDVYLNNTDKFIK